MPDFKKGDLVAFKKHAGIPGTPFYGRGPKDTVIGQIFDEDYLDGMMRIEYPINSGMTHVVRLNDPSLIKA